MKQVLRCVVCGGVAFDCACWRVAAFQAEIERCQARIERGNLGPGRRYWEGQLATATRLHAIAKAAVGAATSLPLFSHAQTAPYPDCPASATCVQLLLPSAFQLSAADGATLGFAVMGVWATAWAVRMWVRALNAADNGGSKED